MSECWFLPLKDHRYRLEEDASKIKSYLLKDQTRVYVCSDGDECLSISDPCIPWDCGDVKLRKSEIRDGFRLKENRVELNYPFIK